MDERNAHAILEIDKASRASFFFKSSLSRNILLTICKNGGYCELQHLLKSIHSGDLAARQHIKILEANGYVALSVHKTNKRCKTIELTEKSIALLLEFQTNIQNILKKWVVVNR